MTCTEPISSTLPLLCRSMEPQPPPSHTLQVCTPALAPQPRTAGVLMQSVTLKSYSGKVNN